MWTFDQLLYRTAISLWVIAFVVGAMPGTAGAVSFGSPAAAYPATFATVELDIEFDDGVTGSFANVAVSESGSGLLFEVELREALGVDADLHDFYFNLTAGVGPLQIDSEDPVTTAYVLALAGPVHGGAGSRLDYVVSFGNGAGPSGNGVLQAVDKTQIGDISLFRALDCNEDHDFVGGPCDVIETPVDTVKAVVDAVHAYDHQAG